MAEDRVVESLIEGCREQETYSAWTRFDALLQRRYMSAKASGEESACFAFLFKALRKAAAPYLAADIASKLAMSFLAALERYEKPLESDYAIAIMGQVLNCFTSVATVSCQSTPVTDLSSLPFEKPALFAINFARRDSNQSHLDNNNAHAEREDGMQVAESAAVLENLLPWYACLLRFCETMACRLARRRNLLLPSPSAAAVHVMAYVGESGPRFSDRIDICNSAKEIQKWATAAARGAQALALCMMAAQKQDTEVVLPRLANDDGESGEKGEGNRSADVKFPPRLGLATALTKMQQWSSCSNTCAPHETRANIEKAMSTAALAIVIAAADPVHSDSSSSSSRNELAAQVIKEQCWLLATFIFHALSRSVENFSVVYDDADASATARPTARTDVYGPSGFFAVARQESVSMSQIALDALCATPLFTCVLNDSSNSINNFQDSAYVKDWVAFLQAFLIVMKACVDSRSFQVERGNAEKEAKRAAFLKVCRALCDKYAAVALAHVPQLQWNCLAQNF